MRRHPSLRPVSKDARLPLVRKPSDVVFEKGRHWVLRLDRGFEVYRIDGTHSVRVARIGYEGAKGLARATEEVERREST